jgi:hypothetical protein
MWVCLKYFSELVMAVCMLALKAVDYVEDGAEPILCFGNSFFLYEC